jgi:hypothetical protein
MSSSSCSVASSLNEIRARAAARFAIDDTCVGITYDTFIGLVFVNKDLDIIAHEDAVKRGLTDPLN